MRKFEMWKEEVVQGSNAGLNLPFEGTYRKPIFVGEE